MSPVWLVLALLPIIGGAERFNCRGRILGAYYADAKSGCKAFHVCVRVAGGGIRDFRFFCPPGTLFHQEAQTCTDWGDDDPLACPADIYDGQFDLYKIGSGFDTKKLSAPGPREDEGEFSLQRAETGDRRLTQNNAQSNGGASDLRAAHSSDFFSGQRDRGRDDSAPQAPSSPASSYRQSFRRATTPRSISPTTQFSTTSSPPASQPSNPPPYDLNKRKLIRKRPIYSSTSLTPTTYSPSTTSEQTYTIPPQQRRNQIQNRNQFNPTPANVPPQYKEEYVEVSRVTPKQNRFFPNSPSPTPFSYPTSAPSTTKKEGLVEIYNYEPLSTPGFQAQNENRPFKVRNSFNVVPEILGEPREDFVRTKNVNSNYNNGRGSPSTTVDYNSSRGFITSTPAYRNFNSVSYEPEKNNFAQFSGAKQSYYNNNNSPTTTPTTTTYATTPASNPSSHFNTVAYNTNLAFNTQSSNYGETDEDDGQYRPPQGEDDGQYRPELYERDRELLSGAHSLNIAASGNRLPEEQKQLKQVSQKSNSKSAAVPRPFRPAPTPFLPSTQTPPEIYTTTFRPQTEVPSTQRTFDYFQTYTTTSRPYEAPSGPATTNYPQVNNIPVRITSTLPPRNIEQRVPSRETLPPTTASTPPPRPPSRPPHFAHPANKKEDASYDYAYYDSDPGFSEYDHIEEFGRTKSRV